jgi:flagellar motor switch protein FliG
MPIQETVRPITNPKFSSLDKITIFLLSLPSNEVEKIFSKLNAYEIESIAQRMAVIGSLKTDQVEELYLEFAEEVEKLTNKPHSFENSERVLKEFFDPLKISERIEESQEIRIEGLSETLKDINPTSLAKYLKNEHPQTISLILSKITPQKAASVFIELPEPLAIDVMNRMLTMGQVHQEMLTDVENTLKAEFENVLTPKVPQDSCVHMADIFNAFDSKSEVKFMQELESKK